MTSNIALSKENYEEWLTHPVTKAHQAVLEVWIEKLRTQMENGVLTDCSTDWQAMMIHAQVKGSLDVIRQLSKMDYEDMMGELSHD